MPIVLPKAYSSDSFNSHLSLLEKGGGHSTAIHFPYGSSLSNFCFYPFTSLELDVQLQNCLFVCFFDCFHCSPAKEGSHFLVLQTLFWKYFILETLGELGSQHFGASDELRQRDPI